LRVRELKDALRNRLRSAGAFDAGIASPLEGYDKAVDGYSPLEIWPSCRSIVVYAVAMTPWSNNTFVGPLAPFEGPRPLGPVPSTLCSDRFAMNRLARQMAAPVALAAMAFLEMGGHAFSLRTIQCKLSGYLAGLGVYGKSGLLINPVLGNRMCLGAIMTDAEMEPDKPLEGFDPCRDCSLCIEACPARAFSPGKEYPESWSRQACTTKRAALETRGFYCHNCFTVCPAGTIPDDELLRMTGIRSISAKKEGSHSLRR